MNLFSAMEITASGLGAERVRINALSSNLANARTTQTPQGGPYRRLDPVFRSVPVATRMQEMSADPDAWNSYLVEASEMRQDDSPPQRIYDPNHPDADTDGFISLPNVNVVEEMVNLITASRAYEAGVTVMQSIKGMARSAINIGA
jgi:flagellar basal-body rod protein FlgC